MARLAVAAETAQERPRDRLAEHEQRRSDPERDPERLRREPRRPLGMAGTGRARDDGGRAVRQEVEDRERAGEHGAREPERRDLRAAEMPDDRRVREHVQRLGGEGAERGNGEPENLAVVGGAEAHGGPVTIMLPMKVGIVQRGGTQGSPTSPLLLESP